MNKRQTEEFAKLFMDLGKLVFASLVSGFFQLEYEPVIALTIIVLGLTGSVIFFIIGLSIFKRVK